MIDALMRVCDDLCREIGQLQFSAPVSHVYNPLVYARKPYREYLRRYAASSREIIFVGMNPGPWGMAQTGIPFGEVNLVRDWIGIKAPVETPPVMHPKKPVQGFECKRSEVSGKRLWGWARKRFGHPDKFFSRFLVVNYCPLLFIEKTGRNRTPGQIRAAERKPLLAACDHALQKTVSILKPEMVLGVGEFASSRARQTLSQENLTVGRISHPSPANPRANQGWEALVERELKALGVRL